MTYGSRLEAIENSFKETFKPDEKSIERYRKTSKLLEYAFYDLLAKLLGTLNEIHIDPLNHFLGIFYLWELFTSKIDPLVPLEKQFSWETLLRNPG